MNKISSLSLIAAVGSLSIYLWDSSGKEEEKERREKKETVVRSSRSPGETQVVLSSREIKKVLPSNLPAFGLHGVQPDQEEVADLYRQLGVIDGEGALDYLLEKYGAGHQSLAYSMAHALTGWMEKDFEGAVGAFSGFLINPNHTIAHVNPSSPNLFRWKGETFHSGLM